MLLMMQLMAQYLFSCSIVAMAHLDHYHLLV